jgi:signal transduction histidine kinase
VSVPGGLAGVWLRQRSSTRRVTAWVLAVAGPALLTLAAASFRSSLVLGGFLFSTLLVVIAVAAIGGTRPALTGVVLGVLARAFLFDPSSANSDADLQPDVISLAAFTVVAAAVSIMIGKLAQAVEEQASSGRVEAAVRRVATLVAHAAPADELFTAVTEEAGRVLQAAQTIMSRYEPGGTPTVVAGWNRAGGDAGSGTARLRLVGTNLTTIVWRTRRPARMEGYADASGAVAAAARRVGFRSAVAAPITVQGRLWGVMIVGSVDEQPLAPDTEARLASFTGLVAAAVSNAENLAALTASRARAVATADRTRRQIERDLHDGAQQQLVSLGFALRLAQAEVPPGLGELESKLACVADGLANVLDDLREMARGIHPAILAEGGLGPALKTLARRSTTPVQLDVQTPTRLPERVEVAAYYLVSETLTNAAKHANASVIHVGVETTGGILHLHVCDDGDGGADPARGSGLVGLKDRVEVLGGTITIHSPVGAGTCLHAELPLTD